MDSLVLKYLAWTFLLYGLQSLFALTQVLLSVYLLVAGGLQLSSREQAGKWFGRLGLATSPELKKHRWLGWAMIAAGAGLLLPFLSGASYWISAVASLAAVVLLLYLDGQLAGQGIQVDRFGWAGRFMRKGLVLSAMLVFCLTLWEGGDLIGMAKSVVTKAKYWRTKEVAGWQVEHNPNVPKIGDMAPDFQLSDYTGEKTVRLADFRGKKPVVLVFGSYT